MYIKMLCLLLGLQCQSMELSDLINDLSIPTCLVTSEIIQRVMRDVKLNHLLNHKDWSKISDIIWTHLNIGLSNYDEQLLCATCFYTVIMLTENQDQYLKDVETVILEVHLKPTDKLRISSQTSLAVSLMYGMFQSSYLSKKFNENTIEILKSLLNSMFSLLIQMAYEYTKYTFIVFKTMKSFQKVCGTYFEDVIFCEKNQESMLIMINHNWENPITGIRDLNRDIMQLLLSTVHPDFIEEILQAINMFYWNKAKFLMLACILKHSHINDSKLITQSSWIEGLLMSLHKPGLVSAGADMYFEVLKKIRTPSDWCDIFLDGVTKILTGTSRKAVENFNNYWYLATLKVFPLINETLINKLQSFRKTDGVLYSMVFLMKQSNKLGILNKDFEHNQDREIEKHILHGLDHWDSSIRMLTFEVLCITQKQLTLSQFECELVLKYLKNNVNSDSTVLRISMLNSLSSYLLQLKSVYANCCTKKHFNEKLFLSFFYNLQELICRSLMIEGNYQRKIASIKMFNIVLSCLNNTVRRKQKGKADNILLQYLIANQSWILMEDSIVGLLLDFLNDPSDDIRDNTAQILLNYYCKEITMENIFNKLIANALESIRSKFFYKVNCGQTMFKLIANILIKEDLSTVTFTNLDEVFLFGLNNIINYKETVVDSIFKGKQQHSNMSILQCVLEVCNKNNYKMNLQRDEIIKLLDVLESISKQFATGDEANTSTDFCQMNDMVQELITASKYKHYENVTDEDCETNITGLHHLVLNCLWLNVKGSCDLSAQLIQYYQDDIAICEQSLNIITHVLETSRHKGAIENAGSALGQAIQHLTSLPEDSEVSKLPHNLLKCKLNELILEANKMASVTRRGAGLSIMVHRIVSSDVQKGKFLFHTFMEKLLEVCNNDSFNEYNDVAGLEKDLPKAIYIHFLTKIVTDSSLASHTLFYSTELAEIAFQNLTDAHWQIRNAALQLYGALVPKLIGQKKASGTEDESIATVACDEFITHFPKLWLYIKQQLNAEYPKTLITDSNLVPILNLLASMAKRYNFSFKSSLNIDIGMQLLESLMQLLGSPIHVVRRLTAKCIPNMYTCDFVYEVLLKQTCSSENLLHGHLMLIKNYCHSHNGDTNLFLVLRNKYQSILEGKKHSYICKELFEEVFKINLNLECIREALQTQSSHKYEPGVFTWINSRINCCLLTSEWNETLLLLKEILKMDDCDQHLVTLSEKVSSQSDIPLEVLQDITNILLSSKEKHQNFGLWKSLYSISLKTDISQCKIFHISFGNLSTVPYTSYKTRYIMTLLSRYASKLENYELFTNVTNYIYTLIQNQTEDDMKQVAVIANNELAYHIKSFPDSIRIVILSNAIMFLQDEDEEIRNMSVYFLKYLRGFEFALNPYLCLGQIFDKQFLRDVFENPDVAIKSLCKKIKLLALQNIPDRHMDDINPFSSDNKNIYLEYQVLKDFLEIIQ